jgi:hypothetical protein
MQIGFSQRIQLEWLEQTAQLFLGGNSKAQIGIALQDILLDRLSVGGNTKRGSREKAITILMKIWVTVPKHMESLRDDAIEILKQLPQNSHLIIHWGMSMSVYPFFGVVAETVGRLIRLQDTVAASHVQRRIREELGERETVARAVRRILRCFVDWGVLQDTRKRGIYKATPQLPVKNKRLKSWLIEAALISSGFNSLSLRSLFEKPVFFPFKVRQTTLSELETNPRLSFFRHGLDEDMATLLHSVQSMESSPSRNQKRRK